MNATWTRVATGSELQRSSHSLSAIDGKIYVFGGELQPRQPRDDDLHTADLTAADGPAELGTLHISVSKPSPRVGAAATTLNGRLYIFSGRGGEDMAPVDERGSLHEYDPVNNSWELLRSTGDQFPQARSYHAMASDGRDAIFVHAGCPEQGRLSDLWSYSVSSNTWRQLQDAPAPARGGTSIAFADSQLYRMNGFDGKTEQGGSLDVYDTKNDLWSTISYKADGVAGPGARSVSALVALNIGGSTSLVTMFGESDPSSLGHLGAGKMLGDVWVFSIAQKSWSKVESKGDCPAPRAWFDADNLQLSGRDSSVVVGGGLDSSNNRLDDLWVLTF